MLDVAEVHLALRQGRRRHLRRRRAPAQPADVRAHWRTRGVEAVCSGRAEGADSRGRVAVWHTVGFVVPLYESFRREGTFDGVRRDITQRLWRRRLVRSRSSVAFAYEASVVPAALTLRSMLFYFHEAVTAPRIRMAKQHIARRSRAWKIDGARKPALRVHVGSEEEPQSVTMTVMTEEGFLAFPQRRARGEGRHARVLLESELREHREANADAEDEGRLVGMVSDDYEHGRMGQGELMLAVYSDCLPFPELACQQRVDALEEAARRGEDGFLSAQDAKRKGFELRRCISQASSSAPFYLDCFDAGQARFSAPLRPPGPAHRPGRAARPQA